MSPEVVPGSVEVAEGVALHILEAGSGPPLVMLPGWSQTAEMFREQLAGLAEGRRLIAVDQRGHGGSPAPEGGYRVHRLAADLRALLTARELEDVALLGHSLGASVIYAYLDLFGAERISSLVLVDQMARALRAPGWSEGEAADAGATMDADGLFAFLDGLRAEGGEDVRRGFLETVTSDRIDPDLLEWMVAENARFPREQAATLIFNNATLDWRDLIPTIGLPALVVAGDSVNVPLPSQRWIHEQIAGSELAVVRAPDGSGTHFPFLENPGEFNAAVAAFLGRR